MDRTPEVSVIIPVHNEEAYLKDCLESLLEQTFPREKMEWIIVDSGSTDATPDILEQFREKGPFVFLSNPGKATPSSMNMAIRKARGRYIVRMDAHAKYPHDYISKSIMYLEQTGADNVGGCFDVHGDGVIGRAFASILTSSFGAGGARFRTAKQSGFVDTVPFGAWRRELFERIGLFDENLVRSEDNDLNQRIRDAGGQVYLAVDMPIHYYCRNSVPAILKTGVSNGNALFFTARKNPRAMCLRHYVPFLLLISLTVLVCGSVLIPEASILRHACRCVLMLELGTYLALDLYFSLKSIRTAPVTLWLYPLFHLTYGLGSALGLLGIKVY